MGKSKKEKDVKSGIKLKTTGKTKAEKKAERKAQKEAEEADVEEAQQQWKENTEKFNLIGAFVCCIFSLIAWIKGCNPADIQPDLSTDYTTELDELDVMFAKIGTVQDDDILKIQYLEKCVGVNMLYGTPEVYDANKGDPQPNITEITATLMGWKTTIKMVMTARTALMDEIKAKQKLANALSIRTKQMHDEYKKPESTCIFTFGDHVFFRTGNSRTWQESRRLCRQQGGDLAHLSFRDPKIRNNIIDAMSAGGINKIDHWIGLYDYFGGSAAVREYFPKGKRLWVWLDGRPDVEANLPWDSTVVHGAGTNVSNCVVVQNTKTYKVWPCETPKRALCEVKRIFAPEGGETCYHV